MKGLFLLFILLSSVHAENTLPVKPHHGAESPVPAGVEVSLELPEKVKLGDMITGTFTVKNTGGEPFDISTGGDYRGTGFPLRLKIRVKDSQGDVLPDASEGLPNYGGFGGSKTIAPGASYDISFPLAGYVTFPGAGICTVEACHDLGWIVDEANPLSIRGRKTPPPLNTGTRNIANHCSNPPSTLSKTKTPQPWNWARHSSRPKATPYKAKPC